MNRRRWGPRIIKKCRNCRRRFMVPPSRAPQPYCSRACRDDPHHKYKIDPRTGCWNWTWAKDEHGYGNVRFGGVHTKAHRMIYILVKGPIPAGLVLDHTCRNPSCVNPDHLDPVTQKVNNNRAAPVTAARARPHCKHGHPWTPETTYMSKPNRGRDPSRVCRVCRKAAIERHLARKNGAKHGHAAL